jgi:septum formation inhibitor-activating ATPase MinD
MKEREVENALEMKVSFKVPSDRSVPLAVNRGNPVVLAEAGADFSKGLRDVAKVVASFASEAPAKKRLFSLARS